MFQNCKVLNLIMSFKVQWKKFVYMATQKIFEMRLKVLSGEFSTVCNLLSFWSKLLKKLWNDTLQIGGILLPPIK